MRRGVTVRDVSWACKVVRDEGTTYGFVGREVPVLEVSEMRAACNQVPYSISSTGQDRTEHGLTNSSID